MELNDGWFADALSGGFAFGWGVGTERLLLEVKGGMLWDALH